MHVTPPWDNKEKTPCEELFSTVSERFAVKGEMYSASRTPPTPFTGRVHNKVHAKSIAEQIHEARIEYIKTELEAITRNASMHIDEKINNKAYLTQKLIDAQQHPLDAKPNRILELYIDASNPHPMYSDAHQHRQTKLWSERESLHGLIKQAVHSAPNIENGQFSRPQAHITVIIPYNNHKVYDIAFIEFDAQPANASTQHTRTP